MVSGTIIGSLGLAATTAAAFTWLVGWADSTKLDDECPNGDCVIGTRGGDRYQRVQNAADASEILIGVGTPMMFGGLAVLIVGTALRGEYDGPRIGARVSPTGAAMEVTF